MEFSRQEYWSGLPFSPPGDLPNPGIEPTAPVLQADSLSLSRLGSLTHLTSFYFWGEKKASWQFYFPCR